MRSSHEEHHHQTQVAGLGRRRPWVLGVSASSHAMAPALQRVAARVGGVHAGRSAAGTRTGSKGAPSAMTWDVPEGDPWATTQARLAASGRLHADGLLDEVPCLACGLPTLSERGGNHICVVCHWQDDDSIRDQPDRPSPVNHGLTLRQAAAHIVETGVYASPSWAWTVPEYFTPRALAARAQLVTAYERLMMHPRDASARKDVHDGRSNLMYAIVSALR